jgi:hypothetical protein
MGALYGVDDHTVVDSQKALGAIRWNQPTATNSRKPSALCDGTNPLPRTAESPRRYTMEPTHCHEQQKALGALAAVEQDILARYTRSDRACSTTRDRASPFHSTRQQRSHRATRLPNRLRSSAYGLRCLLTGGFAARSHGPRDLRSLATHPPEDSLRSSSEPPLGLRPRGDLARESRAGHRPALRPRAWVRYPGGYDT